MYNVKDLVRELARVDVVAMCVVGDEGDIQGADVWNQREALEEVMLLTMVSIDSQTCHIMSGLGTCSLPSPCSRLTPPILANCSFGH